MSNLNKVFLIGRLGADPEMRYTADGTHVAFFNMATSESYKDRSGNRHEKTEWHRIVTWRKLAGITVEYLKKGRLVYIEGKLQSREWEKDGERRKAYEIVASSLIMLPTGQGKGQEDKKNNGASGWPGEDDFVPEFDEDDVPM